MVDDLVVSVPFRDFVEPKESADYVRLIVRAATVRLSPEPQGSACEISLANADGAELARYEGAEWKWTDGAMRSELALLAFFVTFRVGGKIVTVAVEAVN